MPVAQCGQSDDGCFVSLDIVIVTPTLPSTMITTMSSNDAAIGDEESESLFEIHDNPHGEMWVQIKFQSSRKL